MQRDTEGRRRYSAAVMETLRRQAQEAQYVGLTQEQADDLLAEMRERAGTIRTGWANPQYGTNIEEETDRLIEASGKLDQALSAQYILPSDWTDWEAR